MAHNPPMTTRTDRIQAILAEAFAPTAFTLRDDSRKHAKHMARMTEPGHAPQAGETHYHLTMVSAKFEGMNRVARSRAVHEALQDEFAGGLHALALDLRTPDEVPAEA